MCICLTFVDARRQQTAKSGVSKSAYISGTVTQHLHQVDRVEIIDYR